MAEKNYRSFTGLTEFYYKVHGEGGVQKVADPERIKYLQEISVSKDPVSYTHLTLPTSELV